MQLPDDGFEGNGSTLSPQTIALLAAAMAEEGEKIYTVGPGIFSTPERWRARFNHSYVGVKNVKLYDEVRPVPEDYVAFRAAFPVQGRHLDEMQKVGKLSVYSTAAGAAAGAAVAMRLVRAPPLILLSSGLSAVTAYSVSGDIGSWIYGTYKYDRNAVNTNFLTYVRDHRRTTKDEDRVVA